MKSQLSWLAAFKQSPGPKSLKDAFILFLKGICMGSADIIPGVSGGTIAFITGIYDDLLDAIRSFNKDFFKDFFSLKWKKALAESHIRFLVVLLLGIGVAIVTFAQIIHYLLAAYPVYTAGFFFGLILASVFAVGKSVPKWTPAVWICFVVGIVLATWIVNLIPVQTPESLWFIFLCGVIAICAMILPGISGAFLLLVLGKYVYITATLKNPFNLHNIVIIIVFALGCVIGIMLFSRILGFFLKKYRPQTLGLLTGLVLGAIQKIWPWQTGDVSGSFYANLALPSGFNSELIITVVLMIIGFLLVFGLERLANRK